MARVGQTDFYRLQTLGADPDGNPKGLHGVTPAYGAIECKREADALCGAVNLLSNGAHVNAPQREGDSLLHVAARRGDISVVRYLMRRGADLRARDAYGRSPLDHALQQGHEAVAELLRHPENVPLDDVSVRYAFDAGGGAVEWPDLSDIPRREREGVTGPSHFDLPGVRAIVEPDPRRAFGRSSQNELAIEACGHTGAREIARFLLDQGLPQSFCTSLSIGDLDRARELLEISPSCIHERGPHDFATMWYAAIGGGNVEAAELLLEHGVEVDQESMGTTCLHWAAMRGQMDLATFLVEKGAELEAIGFKWDAAGHTPLMQAQERGQEAMVRLLRDLGARS
jgi:cytohesin